MTLQGFISADAGVFVVKEVDGYRLFDRAGDETSKLDDAEFLTFARTISDGRSISVASIDEGVARLDREWQATRGARFYLMLIDPTEEDEGLDEIADVVERLSESENTRNYTRAVLSIRSLDQSLNFTRLARFCEGRPRMAELTRRILATEDSASDVTAGFDAASEAHGFSPDDAMVMIAAVVDSGAWVRLIDAIHARRDATEEWNEIEDVLRPFDVAKSLIDAWKSGLASLDMSAAESNEEPGFARDTGRNVKHRPDAVSQRFANRLERDIQGLLDAGAHFGHRKSSWNPKMKPYIFGVREGVHILDLRQTVALLEKALAYVSDLAANDSVFLFVGTKRVAQKLVANTAAMVGQHFVNHRWLGGTLTNWKTIRRSIKTLDDLDAILATPDPRRKKSELRLLRRQQDKLTASIGGIRNMRNLPDFIFVIDATREHLAIREARLCGIPVMAILDSNASPDDIAFPIPSNDDSRRALEYFCEALVAAIDRGRLRGQGVADTNANIAPDRRGADALPASQNLGVADL